MQILLYMSFAVFLGIVAWEDLRTQTISDMVLGSFAIWHLCLQLGIGVPIAWMIRGVVAGFLLYGLIYLAVKVIYRSEMFGQGDVLLLASCGIVLGAGRTLLAGVLTFYVALLGVLMMRLHAKALSRDLYIALAPSIALSCLLTLFFGDRILEMLQSWIG